MPEEILSLDELLELVERMLDPINPRNEPHPIPYYASLQNVQVVCGIKIAGYRHRINIYGGNDRDRESTVYHLKESLSSYEPKDFEIPKNQDGRVQHFRGKKTYKDTKILFFDRTSPDFRDGNEIPEWECNSDLILWKRPKNSVTIYVSKGPVHTQTGYNFCELQFHAPE